MTQDVSTMTMDQLKAALAAMRAKEKAEQEQAKALPRFAYLMVMADSSLVYWSGAAADADAAQALAVAYASKDGGEVFDYCNRPLPNPKGRKPGTKLASTDSATVTDSNTDENPQG